MKKIIVWIGTTAFIAVILIFLTKLLTPKYILNTPEGHLIREYYYDDYKHNLLFIGDCEVYENFSPQILWDEYGINSYIRGGAQQLVWQSYYLLEESLNYEQPEAVVFNVLSLKYNEPQSEAYNRLNIEGMKWTGSKYDCIKASMLPKESLADYLFPLLRYHSRITELNAEDFKYLFADENLSHNGYLMQTGVKPVESVPAGKKLEDYSFGETAMEYLDRITALCKEKNVELILIKAPVLYPYWYEEWDEAVSDYARKNSLNYINLLEEADSIGIDWNTDTYDAGMHLNVFGAEKLSHYFGMWLKEHINLEDMRYDADLSLKWDEKRVKYYNERNH